MRAALEQLAKQDKRTLSNWIVLLFEKAIADAENKKPAKRG
jgi:hypothetical protein